MSPVIDHALLDHFERTAGDPARLGQDVSVDPAGWELAEELLFDLHLIRHDYADEGYARHVERRLRDTCADNSVIERIKALRL